jgi:hypothetical protein
MHVICGNYRLTDRSNYRSVELFGATKRKFFLYTTSGGHNPSINRCNSPLQIDEVIDDAARKTITVVVTSR